MSIQSRAELGAPRSDRRASTNGLVAHEDRTPRCARRSGGLRSLRRALLGVAIASVLGAVGCGGGSGSGSGDDVARPASAPIDLAPGRTSAVLSWEASAGPVDGYDVFLARGSGAFVKAAFVRDPAYQLRGVPGDRVRVVVVAVGSNGTRSQPSPASPPIRFHAAQTAATQTVAASSGATLSAGGGSQETLVSAAEDGSADATDTGAEGEATEDTADAIQPIDAALREQLLLADARLPLRGPEPNAGAWLQSAVDAYVGAGVSLAGTGERSGDGRRELVWVDAIGQLFVSEGADLAATEDVPSTFIEAIRLDPTERFVALADLDGDGRGEWVIEDVATRVVWAGAADGTDLEAIPAPEPGAALLGVGDFDGDGRVELLWETDDLALRFAGGDGAPIDDVSDPEAFADVDAGDLLAVADVNGDLRDDLVFRGPDDRLVLGLSDPSTGTGGALAFTREAGPDDSTRDRELVGTLDADGDGAADVAWWSDDAVYLWDLYDGP